MCRALVASGLMVMLAGCGAAPAVRAARPTVPERSCPVRLGEAPPGVAVFRTLEEAAAHLSGVVLERPGTTAHPDLAALARAHGNAFFVTLLQGHLHESVSTRSDVHAIFVQPQRVTVVFRVLETIASIPPPCGDARGNDALAVALVPASDHLHAAVGHVRVVRADVPDEPTIPSPATRRPRCDCPRTYRVEDHFIDLGSGRHLKTLAQVYRAQCYGPPAAPVTVPFGAFVVDDDGVEVADGACRYFWND